MTMTTVYACIQTIPGEDGNDPQPGALETRDISATGPDYLTAVTAVEAKVPDRWRILYVRTDDPVVEHHRHDGERSGVHSAPTESQRSL